MANQKEKKGEREEKRREGRLERGRRREEEERVMCDLIKTIAIYFLLKYSYSVYIVFCIQYGYTIASFPGGVEACMGTRLDIPFN